MRNLAHDNTSNSNTLKKSTFESADNEHKNSFIFDLSHWLTSWWTNQPTQKAQIPNQDHGMRHQSRDEQQRFSNKLIITSRFEANLNSNQSINLFSATQKYTLSKNQVEFLISELAQFTLNTLESLKIRNEVNKWYKLYENFRIGLQLGLYQFSEALAENNEDYPKDENKDSVWCWTTWENLFSDLLDNFDTYYAKEIESISNNPKLALNHLIIFKLIENIHMTQNVSGAELLCRSIKFAKQLIQEYFEALYDRLAMNKNLERLVNDPGSIANDFEAFLWANYISLKRIGSQHISLGGILHLNSRKKSAELPVIKRLNDLKVTRNALDAKLVYRWAMNNISQFSVLEKIKLNSNRFVAPKARVPSRER